MNDFIFLEYDIKYSQEIIDLWNEEIGFIYPISPKMFNQNINNKYLVLLIGLFEGLGIKMFEVVSSENIYTINKNTSVKGYIILVEIIFCFVRSILCLIGYFINDIRIILYISILLIFILSFVKRDNI